MIVVGPTRRQVVLPARAGRTYPGYGIAVRRLRFDSWLRDDAVAAGADAITARVRTIADTQADAPRSSSATVATSRPMSSSEPTERPAS